MKRVLLALTSILFSFSHAQNIQEVLLYGQTDLFGSPRYVAMGGAFGALGSDLSAIHDNPAGLSVFRQDAFEFSLGLRFFNNKSQFYNQNQREGDSDLPFGNVGLVRELKSLGKNTKRFHFGISYKRMADFDRNYIVKGQNPRSSILDEWIFNSNGFSPQQLFDNGQLYESLAWETYLTDVTDTNNWTYTSYGTGLNTNQLKQVNSQGSRDELFLGVSGGLDHQLFFGFGLGIPILNYSEVTNYSESGFDENSEVDNFNFRDEYNISAIGLNLKIGVLYRINQIFRIGASYISPSWHGVNGQFAISMNSRVLLNNTWTNFNSPEYFNDQLRYSLSSPQIFGLSAAAIFGKQGLLALDYVGRNFSSSRISSKDFDLDYVQNDIRSVLGWQHLFKVGGEYRFEQWTLRGGYQIQSSPVQKAVAYNIGNVQSMSLGFGYQLNYTRLNLAWRSSWFQETLYPYSADFTDAAFLNTRDHLLLAGIQFGF